MALAVPVLGGKSALVAGVVGDLWGALVLVLTLGTAGAVILVVLAPLLFESPPPGLVRARRPVAVLAVATLVLLVLEYRVWH